MNSSMGLNGRFHTSEIDLLPENMSGDIIQLPIRAYRHYREHGLKSAAEATANRLAKGFVTRCKITTAELERLGKTEGRIWYGTAEGGVKFPIPDSPRLHESFGQYPRAYRPQTPFVCELEHCSFINRYATGLYRGKRVILDTTRKQLSAHYVGEYSDIAKQILPNLRTTEPTLDEPVFPLVFPMFSYYHWMVEYLPKLRLLELYSQKTGETPKILVNTDPQRYVPETLELAGYPSDECIRWDGKLLAPDKAIIPVHREHKFDYDSPSQSSYHPSWRDFRWVRRRMRSEISSESEKSARRVYISRQEADRGRKIMNYDEVMAELETHGFESYQLETLPFKSQVELFKQAEVIMGVHGAGLTNIIFADDPLVFELFPQSVVKPHFYFLSSMMGCEYESLVTEADGNNLVIDIDALRQRFNKLNL